ncbi:MAG: hypothetical protein ACKO7G_02935 [Gammaproteobacteria bacterium]
MDARGTIESQKSAAHPMKLLALNTLVPQIMRAKYQLAISVLPVGLMLGSFLPLMIFSSWLQGRFGIPADSAVRDHPDGSAWIVIFVVAMIVLMLLGYALGWVANAAISRVVFGWSPEKIRAVYLRSELPVHWMKGEETASSSADARAMSEWESQQQVGALRFIATRGVLAYGGWMLLAMHVAPTLVKGQGFTMTDTLPKIAIWACAGAIFGAAVWYKSESDYQKLKRRREPS